MDEQNSFENGEQLVTRLEDAPEVSPALEKATEIDLKEDVIQNEEEHELEIFQGHADIVIIDNGSYMVKAGTADKKAPTLEYRCLVSSTDIDSKEEPAYLEDIEDGKEDMYNFSCPMDEYGRLKEKTQMGNFWHRMLKKLPEQDDFKVLLTEPPHDDKNMSIAQESREKMMTLIDYSGVSACYIANEAQLALYSTGNISGTVVDMGHSKTYITPIYEGHVITQAVQISDVAGSLADEFLKAGLTADWTKNSTKKHLSMIKQKHCVVNPTMYVPSLVKETQVKDTFTLPDNNLIELKEDILTKTPELFFNPSLFPQNVSKSKSGANLLPRKNIKELIDAAVVGTPVKIRNSVSDVVLCGGSSMYQGMAERMQSVLSEKTIVEQKSQQGDIPNLNLIATRYRKYATWIGGSILANLEPFQDKWITKKILDEEGGDRCVHKKIFW